MIISRLRLENFRNYDSLDITFHEGLNILVGDNAQGKTNVLESVYAVCSGRSFRTWDDQDMLKTGSPQMRVQLQALEGNQELAIDLTCLATRSKEIRINRIPIRKFAELIGKAHLVVFSPDDLRLVKEGPQERRRFLDRELSLLSAVYYHDLLKYHKILKQRNKLLKSIGFNPSLKGTLEQWDEQLSDAGARLILKRSAFIRTLEVYSGRLHHRISSGKEELTLIYFPNPGVAGNFSYDTIFSGMKERLAVQRESDLQRGTTSVGPHRDDFSLLVNGKPLKDFGSQGQHRLAALSLKLSETEIIQNETGKAPVVLLDDVMSELDPGRQNELLRNLSHLQILMTVTDTANLIDPIMEQAKIYRVHQGSVRTTMDTGGEWNEPEL